MRKFRIPIFTVSYLLKIYSVISLLIFLYLFNFSSKVSPPRIEEEEPIKVQRMVQHRFNDLALTNNNNNHIQDSLDSSSIKIINDREDKIYKLDYSKSHPFDNLCQFPVLNKDDPDLTKYITKTREIDCTRMPNPYEPIVHQYRNGEILIGRPHKFLHNNFICYFRELSGSLAPEKDKYLYLGKWIVLPLSIRIFIEKDQFVIQCFADDGEKEIYFNAFTYISDKPHLNPPPSAIRLTDFSISLLILESTSKNQFHRHMPFSLKYMVENDFNFMNGYNKIGDNSMINIMTLLAGIVFNKNEKDFDGILGDDGEFDMKKYFNDFGAYPDSIIKRAKSHFLDDAGYVTMWNDEIGLPGFGTFHYFGFDGFHHPIADYYFRPYYQVLYERGWYECSHGESIIPKWLQIWEKFSIKFAKKRHFSFNFLSGLTHVSANNLELYDIPLLDSLMFMEKFGVYENTILIIMGDHGNRISPISETIIGNIEERMPLLSFKFPEKFKKHFPQKYENFKINQNRLISNFDVHETLEEIIDITMGVESHPEKSKHGLSLFKEIPSNRTCLDALIPSIFCTCMEEKHFDNKNNLEARVIPMLHSTVESYLTSATNKSCSIKTIDFSIIKNSMKILITSEMLRSSAKSFKEWKTILKEKQTPIKSHIFDIIFDVELKIVLGAKNTSKRHNALLKFRVQYNEEINLLSFNVSPRFHFELCPNVFVIENLCDCLRYESLT